MSGRSINTSRELNASDNIAPLIRPAYLQRATILLVQLLVVVGLQDLISKFCKGQTGTFTFNALFDRFLCDHLVDSKMLTDVPQKTQHVDTGRPVIVVCQHGPIVAIKIDKPTDLGFKAFTPLLYYFSRVELTFLILEARIANQPGSATHQRDWTMPRLLKALEHQQGNQMPQMQTVCCRVKAAIKCHRPLRQMLSQLSFIGHLGNQTAGL